MSETFEIKQRTKHNHNDLEPPKLFKNKYIPNIYITQYSGGLSMNIQDKADQSARKLRKVAGHSVPVTEGQFTSITALKDTY